MSNLSGHVSMTTRTSDFYKYMLNNEKKIKLRQDAGIQSFSPKRNPILGDKSARKPKEKFDFDTPSVTGEVEKYSKWQYPEVDEGLLSQLPSQKDKIAKLNARTKQYQTRLRELQELNEKNETENNDSNMNSNNNSNSDNDNINNTLHSNRDTVIHNDLSSSRTSQTSRSKSTHNSQISHANSNVSKNLSTQRSHLSTSLPHTTTTTPTSPTLYHQNITEFKKLIGPSNEALQLYRANRAAQYINEVEQKTLRNTVKQSTCKYTSSNSLSTQRSPTAGNNEKELKELLESTEKEIQELELRIGLQSKTKSYQRDKHINKYNII